MPPTFAASQQFKSFSQSWAKCIEKYNKQAVRLGLTIFKTCCWKSTKRFEITLDVVFQEQKNGLENLKKLAAEITKYILLSWNTDLTTTNVKRNQPVTTSKNNFLE